MPRLKNVVTTGFWYNKSDLNSSKFDSFAFPYILESRTFHNVSP